MKGSASQASLPTIWSGSSTIGPSASTTSSFSLATSAPSLPLLQTPQRQDSIPRTPLRSKAEVKQVLYQHPVDSKELFLDGVCLDDELVWLLIRSKLEKLLLQNCSFDPRGSVNFGHLFRFLARVNPSETCFRFATQFKNCTTQWVLYDEMPSVKFTENEYTDSLLFILPGNIPEQSVLNGISSLGFLPSDPGVTSSSLSPQSKQKLKTMTDTQCPNLKQILLADMDLGDEIDDLIPISQQKLNLIYIWNCAFDASDLIWSTLCVSEMLINSMRMGRVQCFRFSVSVNGHITQIVSNHDLPFLMPNSPHLVHGLILPLGQDFPDDLLLESASLLAPLPSDVNPSNCQSFPHPEHNLNLIPYHRCPNLKHILIANMYLHMNIEDLIPISQLKLDLIYLWKCGFKTVDPMWSILIDSMKLINSMREERVRIFIFAIPINGHITPVILNGASSSLMSNSPDLAYGLILSMDQDLPRDLLLNNISLLAFYPLKADIGRLIFPQSKQNLSLVMSRRWPNLKCILLKRLNFDSNIGDFISISRLNLNLIYLWNCYFKASDSIWSALCVSELLINSMHAGMVRGFKFTIPIDGHVTQVVSNRDSSLLMPNSPYLVHGLILPSKEEFPSKPSLDNLSLLALLSLEIDDMRSSSPRFMQQIQLIMNCYGSNLKYILLQDMRLHDKIENFISISRLKLDLIYLWNSDFKTTNPIWSILINSMGLVNLIQTEMVRNFQFAIQMNGHITRVVFNKSPFFLMPNAPELRYVLILTLSDEFTGDLRLEKISFLILLPLSISALEILSPRAKQALESIMGHQHPELKHLLLKNIYFSGDIGDSISISQLKLDLIYLWNCDFEAFHTIWSVLIQSMQLLDSIRKGKNQSFQFTIRTDGHPTQIICHDGPSFLMPDSPALVHGLILPLDQDFPNDLSLGTISFLVFVPSEKSSGKSFSSQSGQTLESIKYTRCPKLKYLLLKDVFLDDVERKFGSIQQLGLEEHALEDPDH